MDTSKQEVSFRQLVQRAVEEDLRSLVPHDTRTLLKSFRPDTLSGKELRQLVLTGGTIRDYLLNDDLRNKVFALLSIDEVKHLLGKLSYEVGNDPHQTLEKLSHHLNLEQREIVLGFFGAALDDGYKWTKSNVVNIINAKYSLFDHQRSALRRVQKGLYSGSRRVVLHMPTGAGKTRTAMNAVCEHLRSQESVVVLWLAFSEELLEQAASEFEYAWTFLGNRPTKIIRFWGNSNANLAQVSDGLIVGGLSKLNAAARKDLNLLPTLGDTASLIIIDEAHQSIAETYAYILDVLSTKRPDNSMLGLTATPGRTYNDIAADARLSKFWTGTKVTLEVPGYDNPVKFLIDNNYLAKPVFQTVTAFLDIKINNQDLLEMNSSLNLSENLLEHLGEDNQWNAVIIAHTTELLGRHRRVIVFATTVRQSMILASVMRALGHHAHTITASTAKVERESILQKFKNNSAEPMVIFNYGVLTTGFDAPATSAAVIARPTKSLVLFSQMVGRVMRGTKAGGNESAEIVSVISPELPGFGDPAEAFLNWEDVWK